MSDAGTGPTPTHPPNPRPVNPPPPSPKPTALALWLIVVGVIFAALLVGGCDDNPHQSCGETNVGTDASPSWEFGCGVNR